MKGKAFLRPPFLVLATGPGSPFWKHTSAFGAPGRHPAHPGTAVLPEV